MADIIQFSSALSKEKSKPAQVFAPPPPARPGLRKILWVIVVLCWPALRFIMACDVLLQLLRTLVLWDTPGTHAGLALLLHFAVFCYLTWFVAYGDPDVPR